MQIPGNKNKNNAKSMHISERAAQVVHGERGNRKIPDSKNKPHPVTVVSDASVYATPHHGPISTGRRGIPDSHNKAGY